MEGYLLDTNIVDYLTDRADRLYPAVRAQFDRLPGNSLVYVSAVTAGEIAYGMRAYPAMSEDKKRALLDALEEFQMLNVTSGVKERYAAVRATLFQGAIREGRKGLRPEQLCDPVTSLRLDVQENDIWLVAQALTHDVTFVTNDKKMKPLWLAAGHDLRVVNWADPDFVWPVPGQP